MQVYWFYCLYQFFGWVVRVFSHCFCSFTKSCPTVVTPWTAEHIRLPHPSLSLEFTQTLVYWVSDAIHPSHPLSSPSAFNLPSIRVFSNELVLCIRCSKYWSFSFSISPSNEYSGLISFRWTCLISWQSKGLSRVFSNKTVQKHQFFCAQLSL